MASELFSRLKSRYKDAYNVAQVIVGVGTAFKVLGILLGLAIVVTSLAGGSASGSRDAAGISLIAGIFLGAIVAGLFYVIGTIVSSQGQILRATLDSAVNTSPHIEASEKAEIMSLVSPTRSENSAPVGGSNKPRLQVQDKPVPGTCEVCGKKINWVEWRVGDVRRCKEHLEV